MSVRAAIAVFCVTVILVTQTIAADGKNVTVSSTYDSSFVGYIYIDDTGKNESFFRAAILITPQYLVSASIDVSDETIGFPKRTLLVKVGSNNIRTVVNDSSSSSDDEETGPVTEQEHEVIQIVRPYAHSAAKRWLSDISVVKVLKPFKLTPYVNVTRLGTSPRLHTDKMCNILVYVKSEDQSTERTLQRVAVKVLSHSACAEKVSSLFNKDHIICAIEPEHQNILSKDEEFCEGNAGAPLVCDDEVVALKSNPHDKKCEPPYVFHRLHIWEDFIKCSVDSKCADKLCDKVCIVTDKDKPETNVTEESARRDANVTQSMKPAVDAKSSTGKLNKTVDAVSLVIIGGNGTRRKGSKKLSNSTVLLRYRSASTLNAQVSVSLIMWNIFFKLFT